MDLRVSREKLGAVLDTVVERRFLFYGFELWPMELEPATWAVEVRRVRPPAPAMGTIVELADVLEKYLGSFGFGVREVISVTKESFAVVVGQA